MPGNVHFADMVSLVSNQGIITACDLPKILEEIRRRDNIEDFILGLVKVEVFPFPEGQKTAKPALIPFKEVTINEAKSPELTTVTYARVDHDLGHVKVITQILSEAAPGSYSEEREVIPITRDALTIDQARSLRSALFARYEWVTSKIANVNEMRRLHCERAQDLLVSPSSPLPDEADEEDVDSNLDEELDPEMMGVENDSVSSASEDEDEGEEEIDVVFPLDPILQDEINKKIKAMVAGKEVVIIDALGNNHGMNDGHTDRNGRIKEASTIPQGAKRPADDLVESDDCAIANKKQRIEFLALTIGKIASMIPLLSNDQGECYFKVLVNELAHVASHMTTCSDRISTAHDVFEDADELSEGTEAGYDYDEELYYWTKLHASQACDSQRSNRRQGSTEL